MSSLMRRIEIRMMKRAGYTRERWILVKNKRGDLVPQSVLRDGEITDADDTPIGRDWPAMVPTRAKYPTNVGPANRFRVTPRILRRSKRSLKWLEARAAKRAQA